MNNYNEEQLSFSIINTTMTVESMRNSGYRSTTHALAELVDNSIEANASDVEIFGVSRINERTGRMNLSQLAVLDNGHGMDSDTLRNSLRYGSGTRRNRKGIGRFGMGLPNSSMSQARRADIWSWQNGPSNALHTFLSIDEVNNGMTEIPSTEIKEIPKIYFDTSVSGFSDTGTLVVWSELDRVEWKQAATTFEHTKFLLGRIYRRFLCEPSERFHSKDPRKDQIGSRRTITCIPIEVIGNSVTTQGDAIKVIPNDPLYLMNGTSCPENFGEGPMFEELDTSPFLVDIVHDNITYKITVRASYARPHTRNSSHPEAKWPKKWRGMDAGRTEWGKHADGNMGISLIRADREIEIDQSWISGNDPTERWWTVEVDFPTELDEIFGVTNTKQNSLTFQRLSRYDWRREALPGENSRADVRRRMEDEGDPRIYLLELDKQIRNAIAIMRPRVKESRQSRSRHIIDKEQKTDEIATGKIKKRIEEGHKGESDKTQEIIPESEQKKMQIESLIKKYHFDESDALQRVMYTIEKNNKVRWIQSPQSTPAFFEVESFPGVIQVAFNENHPVYSGLYSIMHPDIEEMSIEEIKERLEKADMAFRLLMYAWGRFEDEQEGRAKNKIRDARIEWGRYAEEFFDEDDETPAPTDLI